MSTKYFNNLDQIEKLWRQVRDSNFKPRLKKKLWKACNEGRLLFVSQIIPEFEDSLPPKVPAFERAIMLCEQEERWEMAIKLVKQALELGIKNPWYDNRLMKLEKKISQT